MTGFTTMLLPGVAWCSAASGGERTGIRGHRDHIVNREGSHYGLHRLRSGGRSRTHLERDELAHDVRREAAGEGRNETGAEQLRAVTRDTGGGKSIGAGRGDGASALDAARRNVGDIRYRVVAELVSFEIGRTLNDTVAYPLRSFPWDARVDEPRLAHLWNARRLDHSNTRSGLQPREVARGRFDVRYCGILGNGVHAVAGDITGQRTSPRGSPEGFQLRDDVALWQSGERGVLGSSC